MNTVATRFQVTAAAAAVAAAAAFAPIAANAAPAVQLPTAPVSQLFGDLAQTPADALYFGQVVSIQVLGVVIRNRSGRLDRKSTRLEDYATAHPDSFFGASAARAAERTNLRLAEYGALSFTACHGPTSEHGGVGSGIQLGAYGAITRNPC